jgi:alpha-mannosidase
VLSVPARAEGHLLENGYFRVELDASGAIASLVDKRVPGGRELFRPGQPGNDLMLFDDRPEHFDAWDVDASYEARAYPLGKAEIAVVERGPLRATIRVVRRFGASNLTQDISVYRSLPRIDFATRIDWHERHRLLKAAFPLDLRTTTATYEIQYGSVERATHRNTSWDAARFEVWAHRWVDLSESDFGVSLLNDSRYGHDVHDGTLRISLMRGTTYPDPEADQGEQTVTYSLYPHLGDWRRGGTVPAAYALNRPARVHAPGRESRAAGAAQGKGGQPASDSAAQSRGVAASLFTAEPAAAVVEAVKRADDGDGLIVRVYECHGGRHAARARSLVPIASVEECDLLERPLLPEASPAYKAWRASAVASHDTPVWDAHSWAFALRPFEVRTFRLRLA